MSSDVPVRVAEAAQGRAVSPSHAFKDARLRVNSGAILLNGQNLLAQKLSDLKLTDVQALDLCLVRSGKPSLHLQFHSSVPLEQFLNAIKQFAAKSGANELKRAAEQAHERQREAQIMHIVDLISKDGFEERARAIDEIESYIKLGRWIKVQRSGKEHRYPPEVLTEALSRSRKKRWLKEAADSSPLSESKNGVESGDVNGETTQRQDEMSTEVAPSSEKSGLRERLAARSRSQRTPPAAAAGSSPEENRIATPCRRRSHSRSRTSPVRPTHGSDSNEKKKDSPPETLRTNNTSPPETLRETSGGASEATGASTWRSPAPSNLLGLRQRLLEKRKTQAGLPTASLLEDSPAEKRAAPAASSAAPEPATAPTATPVSAPAAPPTAASSSAKYFLTPPERLTPPELPFADEKPESSAPRKTPPKAAAKKTAPREDEDTEPLAKFAARLRPRAKASAESATVPPSQRVQQDSAESAPPRKRKAPSPEPGAAARRRRLTVHAPSTTRAEGVAGSAKERTPPRPSSAELPRSASRRAAAHGAPPSGTASSSSKSSSSAVPSVKELKALLQKSGVDCSECVEKADLKVLWERFEFFRSRPLRELQDSCETSGGSRFASVDECARYLVAPKTSSSSSNRPPAAGAGGSTAATSAVHPESPPRRAKSAQSDLEAPRDSKEPGGAKVEVERILSIRKEAFPLTSDWGFAVFGDNVSDTATLQRAYRTLMKKVHPDKVGQSPRVVRAGEMLREAKELLEKALSQKQPPGQPRDLRSTLTCSQPGHRKIKLNWAAPQEGVEELRPVRRYIVAVVDPAYGRALNVAVLEPDYNEELRRFVSVEELSSYVLAEEELQKMPSLFQQTMLQAQVAAANEAGQSDWTHCLVQLGRQAPLRKTFSSASGSSASTGRGTTGGSSASTGRGTAHTGGSAGSAPPHSKSSTETAADDAAAARTFDRQLGTKGQGAELQTWLEKQRKGPITAWLKSKGWPNNGTKEDLIERVMFVLHGRGR